MVLIVISGSAGAGKTTVAKHLAKKFKLRYFSAGNYFRELAKKHGFEDFIKWHEYVEKHPEIDRKVDNRVKREARKGNVVIEGWIAGHVVKKADLKIFLRVPLKVAARRIAEREGVSLKKALEHTKRRERYTKRYLKEYGIDFNDLNPYHVVMDTSIWNMEENKKIIEYIVKTLLRRDKK